MSNQVDPVKYEVFFNRLRAILEEGRVAIAMVSGSPAIVEGGECMTSLYDGDGNAILTASGTLFHVTGSADAILKTVEWYQDDPGINDGDQFYFADPYIAGTHLMDQIMVKPVFHAGKRVAWVGTMTHTGDVGGVLRGISTEIFHEGPRFQGLKVIEGGKVRPDNLRMITQQGRDPDYVGLDVMARVASNNVIAQGYVQIIERFGVEFVEAAARKLRSDAATMVREKLKGLPDGTWRARTYWSTTKRVAGKEQIHPFKIMVTMTKRGDRLTFDATGSSPQNEDYRNATYVAARSNLFTALAGFLFWDIPWNAGMADMVDLIIPEGTVVNCRFPASCGYGTGIGGTLTVVAIECITKLLAAAGRWDYVNAPWCYFAGGGPGYWIGGRNQYGGVVAAAIYDLFAGGEGAAPYRDGNDTGGLFQNARSCISDVEWTEMYYPFLYLGRRHGTDSGGYGKFRGGMALECVQMVYGTNELSVDYMPTPRGGEISGNGMFGGYAKGNVPGGSKILIAPDMLEKMAEGVYPASYMELGSPWGIDAEKSKDFSMERHLGGIRVAVPEHSIIGYYYTNGGGYGDPLDRDPDRVLQDLKNEAIFFETVAKVYGVVIDANSLEVNHEKTEQRRREIRQERLSKGQRIAAPLAPGMVEPADKKRVLMRIHEYLEIVERAGGEKVISCMQCGHAFCAPGDNYKKYALRWTKDVREMKAVPEDEESISYYQEYICPGCGTLLQVDVWCPMLDGDEPLWDIDVKVQ